MPIDFLVTYGIMGLLFLRQILVFRQPNKINYAPLLLGVGAIGSMVHLLLHPETDNFLLLLRESLLPMFAGLMLFIVMNILQQARQHRHLQTQQEFTQKLIDQVESLQSYISKLEANQQLLSEKEDSTRDRMGDIFESERRALETIIENQQRFVGQIGSIFDRQEELLGQLETFTHQEMPNLDSVVHRHIDMLRIAEQDHFNQLKNTLTTLREHPSENEEAPQLLHAIESALVKLESLHRNGAAAIGRGVASEVERLVTEISRSLGTLKSQSESFSLALKENEHLLHELRSQSELVMKQMVVSAKSMDGIVDSGERVLELYTPLEELVASVERTHGDYVKAKAELEALARAMQHMDDEQMQRLREQVETLSQRLNERIDSSLEKLHEHYHIAQKDISQTVKELSSKAQLLRSYSSE